MSQATRLDRLLLLLDTGTASATRKAAAEQIGELSEGGSDGQVQGLLTRVRAMLRSKTWESRVAAAQAIEAIVRRLPPWDPEAEETAVKKEDAEEKGVLSLSGFDIDGVLERGRVLVSSAGTEYDEVTMDPKERLALQKQQLRDTLGLDPHLAKKTAASGGDSKAAGNVKGDIFNVQDMVQDEDLIASAPKEEPGAQKRKAAEATDNIQDELEGLNARERNQLRRKQRKMAKQPPPPAPAAGGGRSTVTDQPQDSGKVVVEFTGETEAAVLDPNEWPLATLCEDLCHDIFDAVWEVRHGAAMGLREVMKHHASAGGRWAKTPRAQQDGDNGAWLEECAVRMLCVLSLDRFGDFVSDQVVAPVRETCAQVLGVVVRHLPESSLGRLVHVLGRMQASKEWEVKHGGALGLKYLLLVRREAVLAAGLLSDCLPVLQMALEGEDDDVRGVAAEALTPLAQTLVQDPAWRATAGSALLSLSWATLLTLDDLTASTSAVMDLVAAMYTHMASAMPVVAADGKGEVGMVELVRRLYPFFRHNMHSVRRSVLRIIANLLRLPDSAATGNAWLTTVLPEVMHLLFLNLMLERRPDALAASHVLWASLLAAAPVAALSAAAASQLRNFFSAIATPPGHPLDPAVLEGPGEVPPSVAAAARSQAQQRKPKKAKVSGMTGEGLAAAGLGGGGGGEDEALASVDDFESSVATRLSGVQAVAELLKTLEKGGADLTPFTDGCSTLLESTLGTKVQVGAMVLAEWAALRWSGGGAGEEAFKLPAALQAKLDAQLATVGQTDCPYAEVGQLSAKWKTDLAAMLALYAAAGVKPAKDAAAKGVGAQTHLDAVRVAAGAPAWEETVKKPPPGDAKKVAAFAAERKAREKAARQVMVTVGQFEDVQGSLHTSVIASVAAVYVQAANIPAKVAPVVRGLMESIQREQHPELQRRSAQVLVRLLRQCVSRKTCPNGKIVNNLCAYLCEDATFTPRVTDLQAGVEDVTADMMTFQPPSDETAVSSTEEAVRGVRIKKRGAEAAVQAIASGLAADLDGVVPTLWGRVLEPFERLLAPGAPPLDDASAQEAVDALCCTMAIAPALHPSLHPRILAALPMAVLGLSSAQGAVRQMSARLIAELCGAEEALSLPVMECVIRQVLPMLADADNPLRRCGAAEALHRIVQRMGMAVLPFAIFLVVPILGRMSDHHPAVRHTITQCFATLLQLLPLESGIPDPPGLSADLVASKVRERRFLEQLLDTSKVDNFEIPIKIEADLRKYQQEGINWMGFLFKYQLHGILCDDMGLGKTLQSICIIASATHNRRTAFAQNKDPANAPIPTLVVCPPTLVGHWAFEVEKFVGNQLLTVSYTGPPAERARLRDQVKGDVVVITSYDTLRNEIDFLGKFNFCYCVLDEGHVIKNGKSKTTQAVKTVRAQHRLLLSGTPIQNNALELWSLFDFLMPGFLGTEKHFNQAYSKPILMSRGAKCTSKAAEAGALALEALHRQVLPFMLRRTKASVLSDLPPKIIQDYYCDLSPLQAKLYNAFALQQQSAAGVSGEIKSAAKGAGAEGGGAVATHIFQALQYLRKLSNHPKMVLTPAHPEYSKVCADLAKEGRTLDDVSLAPKLIALRQILWDAGIGEESKEGESEVALGDGGGGGRHRVLVFAQMKQMLDIIQNDLFAKEMPGVTYLRMDGSTPTNKRFDMQQQFNGDPSIDVLLLTTHVGGLGLNLTGADTVVFVEHDWNPMRDLQAMDRAHRIGQKSVVNVYRLITRETLEEKIMGLQRFKVSIANSVVNEDNSSLKDMDTTQLLDLFSPAGAGTEAPAAKPDAEAGPGGKLSQVMQSLEEMWDEEQYKEEFDSSSFLAALPPKP